MEMWKSLPNQNKEWEWSEEMQMPITEPGPFYSMERMKHRLWIIYPNEASKIDQMNHNPEAPIFLPVLWEPKVTETETFIL